MPTAADMRRARQYAAPNVQHEGEDLVIMSLDQFAQAVLDANAALTEETEGALSFANAKLVLQDVQTGTRLLRDFGIHGEYVIKTTKGKPYVIFKGRPGVREYFVGTRYGASNSKVALLNIGKSGMKAAVRSNVVMAIVVCVPLEIADMFLNDEKTMGQLLANVAVDVSIAALSGFIGTALVGAAAAITTVALSPVIVAGCVIAAGLTAGALFYNTEQMLGLKEKLGAALDTHFDALERGLVVVGELVENAAVSLKVKIDEYERKANSVLYRLERELLWRLVPPDARRHLFP
jgi:hypothetical protein